MGINVERLKEYLECDDAFARQIIGKFITESEGIMQQLEHKLRDFDREGIRQAAHKMLSSTRIMGMDELTVLLEDIESGADNDKPFGDIQQDVQRAVAIWQRTIREE